MTANKAYFVSFLSHGDVFPLIALAKQIKQQGHPIVFIAPAPYRSIAEAEGFEFIEHLSENEYQDVMAQELWHVDTKLVTWAEFMAQLTERVYELLRTHCNEPTPQIYAHVLCFGAKLFQEKHGAHLSIVHVSPLSLRGPNHRVRLDKRTWPLSCPNWFYHCALWFIDRFGMDKEFNSHLESFRKSLGLPQPKRLFHHWIFDAEQNIALFPKWLIGNEVQLNPDIKFQGFPLFHDTENPTIDSKILAENPVVFNAGSTVINVKRLIRNIIKVCQALQKTLIILGPKLDLNDISIPDHCYVYSYQPLQSILPHACCYIHNGGIGSVGQAIAHSCPQIIIPTNVDQFDNSWRVTQLGVGKELLISQTSVKRLTAMLNFVVSDEEISDKCRYFANRM